MTRFKNIAIGILCITAMQALAAARLSADDQPLTPIAENESRPKRTPCLCAIDLLYYDEVNKEPVLLATRHEHPTHCDIEVYPAIIMGNHMYPVDDCGDNCISLNKVAPKEFPGHRYSELPRNGRDLISDPYKKLIQDFDVEKVRLAFLEGTDGLRVFVIYTASIPVQGRRFKDIHYGYEIGFDSLLLRDSQLTRKGLQGTFHYLNHHGESIDKESVSHVGATTLKLDGKNEVHIALMLAQ